MDHRAVDDIDLRSAGGSPYEVVEGTTGRILGTCDAATADAMVHPGAVYLHQGEPWVVDRLDLDSRQAWVHAERTGFHTQARTETAVRVVGGVRRQDLRASNDVGCWSGDVEVTSRVYAYLKRDDHTGRVLAQQALTLPERQLVSRAAWLTFPSDQDPAGLDAALHAAEHVLVSMLGAFAPCDRWDVSSGSWLSHPDVGLPTVMVWDRHAGGAGFADAGYGRASQWVAASIERLRDCGCGTGCPRCCLASDCSEPERPLDPWAAVELLSGG